MIEGIVLLIGILVFILTPPCVVLFGEKVEEDVVCMLVCGVWAFAWSIYFGFNYEFIFTTCLK